MKNIEIIMIPVSDQQRAKAFYLKLGFKVIVEAPAEHGQTWLQMGLPGQDTTISLASFQGVIMQTDDIDKEISELEKEGITVDNTNSTPWGRFAWLKDPDGNSLCLHQK
jgi:predicted enzyme related to lactoylglutathione lyase